MCFHICLDEKKKNTIYLKAQIFKQIFQQLDTK